MSAKLRRYDIEVDLGDAMSLVTDDNVIRVSYRYADPPAVYLASDVDALLAELRAVLVEGDDTAGCDCAECYGYAQRSIRPRLSALLGGE